MDTALFVVVVVWKLKICGNSGSSKSVSAIFPTSLLTLCLCVTFWSFPQYFKFFHYFIWYGDLWSVIIDVTVVKRLWLVDRSGDSISNHVFFKVIIYFWVHWVFGAAGGLSLVARSGDCSSLRCTGSVLQLSGPGPWASGAVALGLSCSGMCGIFPDKGSNLCPLHWQDS